MELDARTGGQRRGER